MIKSLSKDQGFYLSLAANEMDPTRLPKYIPTVLSASGMAQPLSGSTSAVLSPTLIGPNATAQLGKRMHHAGPMENIDGQFDGLAHHWV